MRGQSADARSDLFSLGVMLFEMATGKAPFRRSTVLETMHAVAYEDPEIDQALNHSLPPELKRIVERCLRKNPSERYASARELVEDLRVARRNTESGHRSGFGLNQRLGDAIEQIGRMRPVQFTWFAAGVAALGFVIYLLLNDVSLGSFLFFLVIGAFLYRRIRHQPQRQIERVVRKISKVPETRLICFHERNLIVVVDRQVSQLYERIHHYVNESNRKLFFGDPISVTIRHQMPPEEWEQLLESPGVNYVRKDVESCAPDF